jgi:ferric-dicitrate binding protein FerR (iron transport regulator)
MKEERIYILLSKHFLGETTQEEENEIQLFKVEHTEEYFILKKLWRSNSVHIKEYNTEAAWRRVKPTRNQTTKYLNGNKLNLGKALRFIAAAAAVIVLSIFVYQFYQNHSNSPQKQLVYNTIQGKQVIILADGSKIWLNNGATLTYPDSFNDSLRQVSLTGEAWFEIAKNPDKPFEIKAINSFVRVLGTTFNVYTDSNSTQVVVETGKVKVCSFDKSKNVIITHGWSAKVDNKEIEKYASNNANYLSWKTGKFDFNNSNLIDIVEELNGFYGDSIIIESADLYACKLTAKFDNTSLKDIISIIELTCDCNIEYKEGKYIIK